MAVFRFLSVSLLWLLLGSYAVGQTTVFYDGNKRIQGSLLSYERNVGLLMEVEGDTVFIEWATYQNHRIQSRRAPFLTEPSTDSTSLTDRYPQLKKMPYLRTVRKRDHRWYTEVGFTIPDGLAQADDYYPAPGIVLGVGYRVTPQFSLASYNSFHALIGYETISILGEARYHLRPTLTSPYVAYRIGSGLLTRSYNIQSGKLVDGTGLHTSMAVGVRFGRYPQRRQYLEFGLRSYRAAISDIKRVERYAFQQYLTYAWGVQF